MSTKTTFKRIALVAVAALGFGVLSVVPSQADVTGLTVTTTNGTGATVLKTGESTTAATIKVQFLGLATADTVTVTIAAASAHPATASLGGAGLFFTESTTSTNAAPTVDTATTLTAAASTGPIIPRATITPGSYFRMIAPQGTANGTYSVTMKYSLGETTTSTVPAGTYSFNAVVNSVQGAVVTNTVHPFTITVAAAPVAAAAVPSAANATAFLFAGDTAYPAAGQIADSATSGSLVAGTRIGTIQVKNLSTTNVLAKDTMTVTMTGAGYLTVTAPSAITGRSFVITNQESFTANIIADGTSGPGTITITTAAGATLVEKVTFFDTKIAKATATVSKAFIKAGTTAVADVFSVVVSDSAGNAVTGGTLTAKPTDTTTTVGGAATCAYSTTKAAWLCSVAGLSATKFGPVAYTFTATGTDAAATVVSTSATVTFADNVATKAVLAGPATGAPGATVDYTLTLTEKNGYPVADMIYGVGNAAGGVLFSATAADSEVSGWAALDAPFNASDSYTSKSGVITSKGKLPIAGTASLSLTLVGDGLQTLAANAIDKTIGKKNVTVSTEVTNPGVDAATDAANEATDAANAATDAALAAAEAADAATTAAQEASDAVAALSETVTKLISDLQAQIKSLAAVVAKIAKKVKA